MCIRDSLPSASSTSTYTRSRFSGRHSPFSVHTPIASDTRRTSSRANRRRNQDSDPLSPRTTRSSRDAATTLRSASCFERTVATSSRWRSRTARGSRLSSWLLRRLPASMRRRTRRARRAGAHFRAMRACRRATNRRARRRARTRDDDAR